MCICHPTFTSVPMRVFLIELLFRLCPHTFRCLQKSAPRQTKRCVQAYLCGVFLSFQILPPSLDKLRRYSEPPKPFYSLMVYSCVQPAVRSDVTYWNQSIPRIRQFPIRSVWSGRAATLGRRPCQIVNGHHFSHGRHCHYRLVCTQTITACRWAGARRWDNEEKWTHGEWGISRNMEWGRIGV